ncbi:MAG: sulfite exporter TauE/SafE family protein [Flammeovirgaceae bacterium]
MLWTAFLLGFLGSFHCLGMCAPIAFAFQNKGSKSPFLSKIVYNLGRLTTYFILGALVGSLGNVLAFSGLQKWLSIFAGLLMILAGVFAVNLDLIVVKLPFFQRLYNWTSQGMAWAMRQRYAAFPLGMLNGILPCGLVYFALFGAVASGNYLDGGLSMLAFGVGTFPLMIGAAWFGQVVNLNWRNGFKKLYPVLFIGLGLLIIVKATNLSLFQGRVEDNSTICLPN